MDNPSEERRVIKFYIWIANKTIFKFIIQLVKTEIDLLVGALTSQQKCCEIWNKIWIAFEINYLDWYKISSQADKIRLFIVSVEREEFRYLK